MLELGKRFGLRDNNDGYGKKKKKKKKEKKRASFEYGASVFLCLRRERYEF